MIHVRDSHAILLTEFPPLASLIYGGNSRKNHSFYTVLNHDQTLFSIPSNLENVTIDAGCQDKGLFDSRNLITPNRNPNQTG